MTPRQIKFKKSVWHHVHFNWLFHINIYICARILYTNVYITPFTPHKSTLKFTFAILAINCKKNAVQQKPLPINLSKINSKYMLYAFIHICKQMKKSHKLCALWRFFLALAQTHVGRPSFIDLKPHSSIPRQWNDTEVLSLEKKAAHKFMYIFI